MARAVRSAASHRAIAAVVTAMALGVPTAAYPISLSQLLHLSLEQLLRLEITALGSSAGQSGGAPRGR